MRYRVKFLLHEHPNVVRIVTVDLTPEELKRVKTAEDPDEEAEVFAAVRAAHVIRDSGLDFRWWGECAKVAAR